MVYHNVLPVWGFAFLSQQFQIDVSVAAKDLYGRLYLIKAFQSLFSSHFCQISFFISGSLGFAGFFF